MATCRRPQPCLTSRAATDYTCAPADPAADSVGTSSSKSGTSKVSLLGGSLAAIYLAAVVNSGLHSFGMPAMPPMWGLPTSCDPCACCCLT